MVVLDEVYAIVAEIACMKVGIFEVVYLKVSRSCLRGLRILPVSSYNLACHEDIPAGIV
jgi:hypothetical protein